MNRNGGETKISTQPYSIFDLFMRHEGTPKKIAYRGNNRKTLGREIKKYLDKNKTKHGKVKHCGISKMSRKKEKWLWNGKKRIREGIQIPRVLFSEK